jgi:hypothetical protein
MKWLKQTFGGNYYLHKKTLKHAHEKSLFTWRLTRREEIEKVLLAVMPYLRIKKQQAKVLLEFVRIPEMVHCAEYRAELFLRIKELKHKDSVTTNMMSTSQEVKIESELHGDMQSAPAVMQTA